MSQDIEREIADARAALLHHPVYAALRTIDHLRSFMANHVFAVWDFMTLLKALQGRLTCVTTPWVPPADPRAARIINEIVLGEESDEIAPGEYLDHYRLYLAGMREVAADTGPIERFVESLRTGSEEAVARLSIGRRSASGRRRTSAGGSAPRRSRSPRTARRTRTTT